MTSLDEAEGRTDRRPPFYMRGNYAPVMDEVEAFDLPVQGALPPELNGRFFRNGANPAQGTPGHWFGGDGMLHGIRVREGVSMHGIGLNVDPDLAWFARMSACGAPEVPATSIRAEGGAASRADAEQALADGISKNAPTKPLDDSKQKTRSLLRST